MSKAQATIKVRGEVIRAEAYADEIITPGMLLIETATGFKKHDVAGKGGQVLVAYEDELQGNGIDVDYPADAKVQADIYRSGDRFFATVVTGQTLVIGDYLTSNGDGKLKKANGTTDVNIAKTKTTVTTTADTGVIVEVL